MGQYLDPKVCAWESPRDRGEVGGQRQYNPTVVMLAGAERPLGVGVDAEVLYVPLCRAEWLSALFGAYFGTKL